MTVHQVNFAMNIFVLTMIVIAVKTVQLARFVTMVNAWKRLTNARTVHLTVTVVYVYSLAVKPTRIVPIQAFATIMEDANSWNVENVTLVKSVSTIDVL